VADAILMPVYNEAPTVSAVLDAVRCHFEGEILVVDDGSTDGTARILEARDDVVTLRHPVNCGYGRALAEGFAWAVANGIERVVTMDCDGQHEPAHITQFLTALGRGSHIVSGSRYLPGSLGTGAVPAGRQRVNQRITAMVNDLTGWGITDAFCGFKAYPTSVLTGMTLREPGYAMPLELWIRIHHAGIEVREIPVERIYCDNDRTFGGDLDDAERRLEYYLRVWNATLKEVRA
jgi:glycosyltransferase involved in cell wall biosynthesis